MAQHTFNNTKINVEFDESTSRQQLNSGENISTLFGKIKKIFSDLKSVCFSGSYNDLSDKPTSLTANGGNADTVNNHTVESDVPIDAVFTDTTNSDVTANGNPVQLVGLQCGVPFADISVSGGDIVGQDLTVNACGKNLIPNKYTPKSGDINSTIDENGIVTVSTTNPFSGNTTPVTTNIETLIPIGVLNRDCTIGITWIDGFWRDSDTNSTWLGTNIAFYDKNKEVISGTTKFERIINGVRGLNKIATISNKTMEISETAAYFSVNFWISGNTYLTDFKYALQLEMGTEATPYEPYHGATYTITPDSNHYTIPDDIRQHDGLNNITVSAGELSVVGVKENAAIKRIWDEIDKIKTAIIVSNGEI